ncbi:MAG: hypothetical protein KC776_03090 [Myxococcales bacterium]|nr:hypothetical protein [Myxococcales bacterium]MCB9582539.1 hypothetical protein [Polyangiaceae bacterium]
MRPGHVTFDDYWAAFVLEHWHSTSRRRRVLALGRSLARAGLGVVSPRLSALLNVERPNARWAAAALLLSIGKSLARTMDREVARLATIDTEGTTDVTALAPPAAPPVTSPSPMPAADDWAVWM